MTEEERPNEFICINDKGGYIGGFWWVNSGIWNDYPGIDYWGAFLSVFGNTWNIGWAGELWFVRSVTKN